MSNELVEQEHQYYFSVLERYAADYLNLRVAHMVRVRPSLRGHLDDLVHQVKLQLFRVLRANRPFGGKRLLIVDLLIGDDAARRKNLMTPTDQNTMINDLIDKADDKTAKTGTITSIKNLRTLYSHFDTSMEMVVETLQTFVWLDLPDVIDFSNLEISLTYLMEVMKNRGITDRVKASVNRQLRRELARDLAMEEAILLHVHRCRAFLKALHLRLDDEPIHMQLFRRELMVADSDQVNQLIMKCAQHIHNAGQMRTAGALTPEQAAHYARAMGIANVEQVTLDVAMQFERQNLLETRNKLASEIATAASSGQPINHKLNQLKDLNAHFDKICAALKQAGVDLDKPAPVPNPEKDE